MKRAIYGHGGDGNDQTVDGDVDGRGEGNGVEDQEDEVEKLEALMLRMQAVRGKSQTLLIQGRGLMV